ncbi:MAG: hypothetical protein LJE59_10850 [Chromatiaceae bacterium]|nr:hypothetical protein [Chromatiaceae bacterium]
MVEALGNPLNLIIVALGVGFLLPLIERSSPALSRGLFNLTIIYQAVLPLLWLLWLVNGAAAQQIQTAGIAPPFSINLRLGLEEAFFVAGVNLASLLGAWYLGGLLRGRAAAMSVFLILSMGVDGMIMTRDLFNLFIFIEITAIATYGLLSLERNAATLTAGFKYIIATSLASTFFLLGVMLFYYLTGTLNIDGMREQIAQVQGPLGMVAMSLLVAGVVIELKPYPANGWGLDVYESAPTGIAAMVSVGVSAGALFALYKILPLIEPFLPALVVVAGTTFLASNIIGLKQNKVRRLLGYSSIAQVSLLALAMVLLTQLHREDAMPLVIGGLFLNHLLAKAGLFWLSGALQRNAVEDWRGLRANPLLLAILGLLLAALAGLPPFPGFWAKWELVMQLSAGGMVSWVALILVGSLLEAVYLFRWFGRAMSPGVQLTPAPAVAQLLPIVLAVLGLLAAGHYAADSLGLDTLWVLLPAYAGIALVSIDGLPTRPKGLITLAIVAYYAYRVVPVLEGLTGLFGLMLLGGGLLMTAAGLYRGDTRRGYYALLTMLLLSFGGLLQADTSLEFFLAWEFLTVSSYLLLCMGRDAAPYTLAYLIFSLAAAFLLLAGFGLAYAETQSIALADLANVKDGAAAVLGLLLLGFLTKAGALGVHVWLPGAYAEADDDFSAMLAAVLGKAAVFGLFLSVISLGLKGGGSDVVMYLLSWIGLLTAFFGALMAIFQEDLKKMLAYSSMGQVGYMVAALATGSHLGWVAAGYLAVNHLLFKGLLFLVAAGIILRVGQREMYKMGGLIHNMPVSFFGMLIAIIALSGVPPLTGFGGKWLMLNALLEKGWYWQTGLAFFASAVAFLYLFRMIHTVFLGQRKRIHKDLRDAPLALLIPQLLLVFVILALSVQPNWLVNPIAAIMASHLPQTLVMHGSLMQSGLGYWDGFLVINVVGAVFMVPLLMLLVLSRFMRVQRVKQFNIVFAAERPESPETTHYAYDFYSFYDRALGFLVLPRATAFWNGVAEWSHSMGTGLRIFYTGNGQTYALYILLYVVTLYFAVGGPS